MPVRAPGLTSNKPPHKADWGAKLRCDRGQPHGARRLCRAWVEPRGTDNLNWEVLGHAKLALLSQAALAALFHCDFDDRRHHRRIVRNMRPVAEHKLQSVRARRERKHGFGLP